MARRALTTPPDTESLMQLQEYMKHAQADLLPRLEAQLRSAVDRMYFLNEHTNFTTADIKLNNQTIQWKFRMPTVFEEHDAIVHQKRLEYEDSLKVK
jgi:dynein heavy chain